MVLRNSYSKRRVGLYEGSSTSRPSKTVHSEVGIEERMAKEGYKIKIESLTWFSAFGVVSLVFEWGLGGELVPRGRFKD